MRCDGNKLHARITDEGYIEVKCRSKFCGASADVVVLHAFDPKTGRIVITRRYRNPAVLRKGKSDG
jgi:hypothetical protein